MKLLTLLFLAALPCPAQVATSLGNGSFKCNSAGTATVTARASSGISGTATLNCLSSGIIWTTTFQTIDGFGAATAYVRNQLTSAQQDLLWTTPNGIGLNLDREFLDCATGVDGFSGNNTNAAAATSRGARLIETVSGIPPSFNTGGVACDMVSTPNSGQYTNFANYLLGLIQSISTNFGVTTFALSPQNEPDQMPTFGGSTYTPQQIHDFIAVLAPIVSPTPIYMPEPSGWDLLQQFAGPTMSDATTAAEVTYMAAHDYDGATDAQQTFGKHLWQSEVSDGSSPLDLSMTSGLSWAENIHTLLTGANVNAWLYWSVAYINPSAQTDNTCLICNNNVSKRLYTIGNFSKYVRPGMVRISAPANPSVGVNVSAYKDPSTGNFAIVAINTNGNATSLSQAFIGFTSSTVTPHVTSATQNLVDLAPITAGSAFTYSLPAQSVVTFTGTNGS